MIFRIALLAALLISSAAHAERTQYGEELKRSTPVRISELTSNPAAWVNKRIHVEGLVDDVCPMKGCWVDILDNQSKETMRFKVQDDVIVFPVEARGATIVAEGVFRRYELDEEAARARMKHLAEEKGEDFDPKSVSGPLVVYQIEGDAAVVGQ